MKRKNLLFLVLPILFIFKINFAFSQVNVQDSLALVDLFNNTNGVNWTNKTNWLTGSIDTWYGVTLLSGRVDILNLSTNNLSGSLPSAICQLTSLRYLYLAHNSLSGTMPSCFSDLDSLNSIDLSFNNFTGTFPMSFANFPLLADVWIQYNQFTDFPNLLSDPEITNVNVQNNKLTFEDIENNIGINNFIYAPQDSVNADTIIYISIFDTLNLSTILGGNFNSYSWIKNGKMLQDSLNHLVGTKSPVLTINQIALADSGIYTCLITNSRANQLQLMRRFIIVHVVDTRLQNEIFFTPGGSVTCGDSAFQLIAKSSSGSPLAYSLVSNNANFSGTTISPYDPGYIIVHASDPGNQFYRPVSKDTTIYIFPNPISSTLIAQSNSPVKAGDTLNLSVQNASNLNSLWTTPLGSIYNGSSIQVLNVNFSDAGLYLVEIRKNGCLILVDTIQVLVLPDTSEIEVFELITPNGDGHNDVFYIKSIEKYSDSQLTIYNNWNQILYKEKGYKNNWNGDEYPSGSYYYLVEIESIKYRSKGRLYIRR